MINIDPLDPYSWIYGQQLHQGQQQPLNLPLMSPPEQESTLSRLGGKVMGGVGYVGSVLDKTFGGRALRGVLGGKPEELLSLIPGSDTLGLTDEQNRVSGKDLLGLHDDSWGSTLAGIGTEMALDPSMYLTFGTGALSRAGQAAKAAGVLPPTAAGRVGTTLADLTSATGMGNLAQVTSQNRAIENAMRGMGSTTAAHLGEHLGGVAGLRLPFSSHVLPLGTGQTGLDVLQGIQGVGSALDSGLSKIPFGPGLAYNAAKQGVDWTQRMASSLFDPRVLGATTHMGQEAARQRSAAIQPLLAGWQKDVGEWGNSLLAAGHGGGGGELRNYLELLSQGNVPPELAQVGSQIQGRLSNTLQRLQELGVDVSSLHDVNPVTGQPLGYAPRSFTLPGDAGRSFGAGRQPLAESDMLAREPIFKNLPGGSESINQMGWDPLLSGPQRSGTPLQAGAHVRQQYLGMSPADEAMRFGLNQKAAAGTLTQQEEALRQGLNARWEQSERLADYLGNLDPRIAASGMGPHAPGEEPWRIIGRHPLEDILNYGQKSARTEAGALAAHDLLAQQAVPLGTGTGRSVPLAEALTAANLKGAQAPEYLLNQLRQAGHNLHSVDELRNLAVPEEVVKELQRYTGGMQLPENLKAALAPLDWLTNLTKAGQTLPWVGFHMRNLLSGGWQNAVQSPSNPLLDPLQRILQPVQEARQLLGGQAVGGANLIRGLEHLSPEEATRALGREMFAHAGMDFGQHGVRELAGGGFAGQGVQGSLEQLMGRMPGYQPRTLSGALGELGGNWNPLQAGTEEFAPFKSGRAVGDVVEGTNRGALFLQLRRQGFSAEEAGRMVLESHFDYRPSAKTNFERDIMTRLVPYYSYAKGNIPHQLETLAKYPGGANAQLARVAGDLRQQEGFLPEYLGQGLAVPLGEEQGGTRRYLTRTDLPPEQAFETFKGGPHGLQNSLMGLLGQTNPLLKGPLELASGKQFFTGRDLEDLYQTTGSTVGDSLLMNSPFSRLATTLRTVTDSRKWADPLALPLNLATGLKVSDIDMEKMRSVAGREVVQDFLRGQPEIGKFQQIYVKPGMENLLTPQEVELLRLNKTLEHQALLKSREKQQTSR